MITTNMNIAMNIIVEDDDIDDIDEVAPTKTKKKVIKGGKFY